MPLGMTVSISDQALPVSSARHRKRSSAPMTLKVSPWPAFTTEASPDMVSSILSLPLRKRCHTIRRNDAHTNIMSYTMSSTRSTRSALVARQTDLTQRLILDAALEVIAEAPTEPLSVRATARRAGMSERTVFRYFATREDLVTAA